MRRFFELFDDMEVSGRWHIGEIYDEDGFEPTLDGGRKYLESKSLSADVTNPGQALDFSLTSFAVPLVNSSLAKSISFVAGSDVQCVPINIAGYSCMVALNAIRVVKCLDEKRSEFIKWKEEDKRPDRTGGYRQVTKLVIDPKMIPLDANFFRIDGWLIALIVSDAVKAAMEHSGCFGAKFFDVLNKPGRSLRDPHN